MHYVVSQVTYEDKYGQPTYLSIRDERTRMPDIPACAYLVYLRDKNGSPLTTQRNYATTITHLLNAVAASSTIQGDWRRIKPQHLAAYHRNRATEIEESSLDVMVSRLKTFMNWAYTNGWLDQPIPYSWRLPFEEERKLKIRRAEQKSHVVA